MAVQSSPVLPQTPKVAVTQFTTTAAANTFVSLYTGGANGSKITGVVVTNTSTQTIVAQLAINSTASGAAVNYIVSAASLSATAGSDGTTAAVNLMNPTLAVFPVDGDNNPYLFLTSSNISLQVTITSSIQTAAKTVNVAAIGADF